MQGSSVPSETIPAASSGIRRWLRPASGVMGASVALVGASYLVAWLSGYMATLGFKTITMKTNAALCLLLSGSSLMMLIPASLGRPRCWAGRISAGATLLLGALNLSEHVFGWDMGIDQLLATEPPGALAVTSPNRMGPPASLSFTLAGLALLFISLQNHRAVRAAQGLAWAVCTIALLGAIGFFYGAKDLYGVARYTGIAWPTDVALLTLGLGLLCVRPTEGLMAQVTANDPGGVSVRRTLPILLLPLVLGWLRLAGERAGVFDAATGTALMMITFILILSAVAYNTGRRVSRSAAVQRETDERRKVAEAVRDERERLYAVLETLPAYVVLLTTDYHLRFANRFFEDRFGKAEGRRCYEFLFHRGEPCEPCETFGVLKTNTPHRRESTGPDGRYYDIYDFPFTDTDGSALIMEMGIDITARKQAESALQEAKETLEQRVVERTAELRQSEERLRRSQRIAHLGSWELDLEKNELTWSDEVYRIFGLQPRQFGATYEAFLKRVHPDDRAAVDAAYSGSVREGKDAYEIEHRVVRKGTDEIRWVLEKCQHVRDETGRIIRSLGMVLDITERKLAENAQRASEARYQDLFNTMSEGFAVHEMLWDENGRPQDYRFLQVNPAFERLTGLKAADLVGHKLREILPDTEPVWIERYGRVVVTGQPDHFEEYHRQTDHWYEVSASRTAPGQFAVVFLNVTERKRAEEKLRQTAEELARSNADLEQFAYVASHDLQEPLRMVSGYMSLLSQRYGDRLEGKALQYMNFAVDGSKRMSQLIHDLLSYSRVQSGTLRKALVNMNEVFDQAVLNCKGSIRESGARITHDELPTLTGDATQLCQLLQNLIGNAVKFRRQGVPPEVHVSARREGESWDLCVSDNGIGIPSDAAERIFMIFQQLHTRDEYPGTGVGLAICKKVVERHGGNIRVESTMGSGSNFLFTLPA